jgi:hypothetical protein
LTNFTNIMLYEEDEGQAISVGSIAAVNGETEYISSGGSQQNSAASDGDDGRAFS